MFDEIKKPKIFISHIHEDAPVAILLKKYIEQAFARALETFISSDGTSIPLGGRWLNCIEKALGDSSIVIILASPNSVVRPWINFEAGAAWVCKAHVIPVCIRGMKISVLSKPLDSLQACDITTIQGLKSLFENIARIYNFDCTIQDWDKVIAEFSSFMEHPASTTYINGERESFAVLTEVTSKAKDTIRATRFFPISVLTVQNYVQAMENRILGTNGRKPLKAYYRIVAVNNIEKQKDVIHHLNMFSKKPFRLYLTTHQNDFELVIVDETDAFICFYKKEKVVASCLHIRGKMLVREFIDLFNILRKKDIVKEFDCSKIKREDVNLHLKEVQRIFNKYCTCTSPNSG